MAREIFGDVTKPSISIGNRKWYTVPVSLGTHSLIVLALIALPVLAPALLPVPDSTTVFTTNVLPPSPPPPPRGVVEAHPKPPANPNAAPTVAPTSITKELEVLPAFENADPIDGVIVGTVENVLKEDPPPPVAPPALVRVGGQVRPPTKIAEQPLVYPSMAIAARVDGMVIVEATIDTDGRVSNAKVLKGKPLLNQAALEAVGTWRYTPTLLNGVPVSVIMTVVVQFKLN